MLVSVTVWVGLPLDFCLREVWNVGPAREWSMWVYNPNECWSNGGYVFFGGMWWRHTNFELGWSLSSWVIHPWNPAGWVFTFYGTKLAIPFWYGSKCLAFPSSFSDGVLFCGFKIPSILHIIPNGLVISQAQGQAFPIWVAQLPTACPVAWTLDVFSCLRRYGDPVDASTPSVPSAHRIHGAAIYGVPWIPSIYPLDVSIFLPAPWIRHGICYNRVYYTIVWIHKLWFIQFIPMIDIFFF